LGLTLIYAWGGAKRNGSRLFRKSNRLGKMKKITVIVAVVAVFVILTSCATNQSTMSKSNAAVAVEVEVLKDMLIQLKGTRDIYGACFIEADAGITNYVPKLFDASMPRFEFGFTNFIESDFVDKITDRKAVELSVRVRSISNNCAVVDGATVTSGTSVTVVTYHLKWTGSKWTITSKLKSDGVAENDLNMPSIKVSLKMQILNSSGCLAVCFSDELGKRTIARARPGQLKVEV
jgi:hypothetical protein